MTILVTGGTGLVGSRLLKRFAANGTDCRALVRPGKTVPEGIQPVEGDVLHPETLSKALVGVTAIVHLAAVFRTTDEARIWAVNLDGTRNLIAATQAISPQARFLLASTSNVYGPELTHPGRETDATTATPAYPASKIQAEAEVRASGLNWAILRFPFVYGDQDGHLEAAPHQLAEMGWHPARKLSVIHHEDIATAIDLALTGELDGRTVNIADDSPLTAYEMAQLVGSTYESSGEPLANPWQGHMDISLARSLGFRPKVPTAYQAYRDGRI